VVVTVVFVCGAAAGVVVTVVFLCGVAGGVVVTVVFLCGAAGGVVVTVVFVCGAAGSVVVTVVFVCGAAAGGVGAGDCVWGAAGGVAVIAEALTDNKNRTAGDVRHIFDKYGGALGQTGCVSFMFERKGVIIAEKQGFSEEDMMMLAINAGAEDFQDVGDVYEILTIPQDLGAIAEELSSKGVKIVSQGVDMIPSNTIDPLDNLDKVTKLLDLLEENEDIQNVYHNAELPEEPQDE
jgi:hypothetical protein